MRFSTTPTPVRALATVRRSALACALVWLVAWPALASQDKSNSNGLQVAAVEDMCAAAIDRVELEERLPRALVRAIAMAESGRRIEDRQANFAWPWTINASGEGQHFPTKEAAIAAVKRLKSAGVSSIDVGCMQVNLHFHPKAFDSLEDAFDPAKNVAYGAKFLKELHQLRRSWGDAVAYYHSANSEYNIPYREKVYKVWASERQRVYEEERAAILAAYAERRAELERQREALRLSQARREAAQAARPAAIRAGDRTK